MKLREDLKWKYAVEQNDFTNPILHSMMKIRFLQIKTGS